MGFETAWAGHRRRNRAILKPSRTVGSGLTEHRWVLLGFVMLANLEFDARAVGNRIEDRSELLFGPLVLPFDAKIEVLRESLRLREIQLDSAVPPLNRRLSP